MPCRKGELLDLCTATTFPNGQLALKSTYNYNRFYAILKDNK